MLPYFSMSIDDKIGISLSDGEILDWIDGKANVLTYSNLENFDDIDDVLGPHNALILLYQTTDPSYGHWVCLFKNGDEINFFDPLGIFPDKEIDLIPKKMRKVFYDDDKHLTRLLYNYGGKIVYNEVPLQKNIDGVNTCGRHVACRLIFRDIPQDDYISFMKKFDDPDHLVTYLTS